MAKKSKLCRYCKGTEAFTTDSGLTRWGVRCTLSPPLPIRTFYTEVEAQHSIDEWCTGDGRCGCRPYLLLETGHSYNFSGDLLREFEAMEEHTVAKQKYYCKCGRTFEKSSTASETGYRMDDYGPEHECYGCPFVEPVTDGWGATLRVKSYECRAADCKIDYTTVTDMTMDGNWVVHVYTLDLPWLDNFIRTYLQTPGANRERDKLLAYDPPELAKAFRNVSILNGRDRYAFDFKNNKTGKAARKAIFEEFFNEDKTAQMGPGPGGNKERILHMIEYAKAKAREEVEQTEDEIFAPEEEDAEVKIQVPTPSEESCPYYKGIETIYSPKGYCIDCMVRKGFDKSPYDLKSWALDAVNKNCIGKDNYAACHYLKKAQQVSSSLAEESATVPPQQPPAAASAIPRNITDVTAEIRFYKAQTVQNIIEIGKRLNEAKALLEHGQWGDWLRNEVEFSQDVAGRFMLLAREYPNSAPERNLSYSNLLALLAVPADEREEFMEATHTVDGVDKTVDEMSKRELQKVIKERDDALRAAEEQRQRASLQEQLALNDRSKLGEQTEKMRLLKDKNRRQRLDIERLENKPIDVAVQQPSDAQMNVMRENIRHEVMQSLALPDTYFAKKGTEEATVIFMDTVSGAAANGIIALMRMDGKAAAKTLRVYISTLETYATELKDRLNLMLQVDRSVKEGTDDVDW